MKNKRKNKFRIKNEALDTPHNTGQYLCHIYKVNELKDSKKPKESENDNLGLNFFEDEEDDDFDDDFEFKINEGSKRDRLMSMEGNDIDNFFMSPKENDKKIFKSAILLDKPENHLNFDFNDLNNPPLIEEK